MHVAEELIVQTGIAEEGSMEAVVGTWFSRIK